jgi:hypothetical protein
MNQPDNRSRAQIERAQTLTERLKAILVEVAEAPDASLIIFEAAGEAFNELGAQERHEGTLVRLLLDMARTACVEAMWDARDSAPAQGRKSFLVRLQKQLFHLPPHTQIFLAFNCTR